MEAPSEGKKGERDQQALSFHRCVGWLVLLVLLLLDDSVADCQDDLLFVTIDVYVMDDGCRGCQGYIWIGFAIRRWSCEYGAGREIQMRTFFLWPCGSG